MSPTDLSPECLWALETIFEDRAHEESPADAQRLRAHLGACPACRAAADWDRRLAHLLEADPGPAAPSSLGQRAHALVRRRRFVFRVGVLATAAAVLLAAGLTLSAFRGSPPPQPQTEVADLHVFDGVTAPPVDPLAVLDQQQRAWIAALQQEFQE